MTSYLGITAKSWLHGRCRKKRLMRYPYHRHRSRWNVGRNLKGMSVFCDCEMVASGITRRFLTAGNDLLVTLNDARTPQLASDLGTTRSAAAVELWGDRLAGALVVIGNAPTTLFRCLEVIAEGGPRPAAIIGCPVGFVGAAESKQALADTDVPFLVVHGTRGGSAMASSVVNALALGKAGGEG